MELQPHKMTKSDSPLPLAEGFVGTYNVFVVTQDGITGWGEGAPEGTKAQQPQRL